MVCFTTFSSKYKYVYVDLYDNDDYSTITLSAVDGYAHQISSKLHVIMFIQITKFSVYLKNEFFYHMNSPHSLRIGLMTMVKNIHHFQNSISIYLYSYY